MLNQICLNYLALKLGLNFDIKGEVKFYKSTCYAVIKSEVKIKYQDSAILMQQMQQEILDGESEFFLYNKELNQQNFAGFFWLLEHEEVFTIGSSGNVNNELLDRATKVPVINTNRGGKITYHGPGQIVCYLVTNLRLVQQRQTPDVKGYVEALEGLIIKCLANYGIDGYLMQGKIGVWTKQNQQDKKIAAIGVRISRGIATHGFAVNLCCDLSKFNEIIPCGIQDFGVCSLVSLKPDINASNLTSNFTQMLCDNFNLIFKCN